MLVSRLPILTHKTFVYGNDSEAAEAIHTMAEDVESTFNTILGRE